MAAMLPLLAIGASAGVGSMIGNKIAGGGSSAPAAIESGPKVMPLADDAAVKAAKRRSIAAQMSQGGRTSTMLTSDSDTLGN